MYLNGNEPELEIEPESTDEFDDTELEAEERSVNDRIKELRNKLKESEAQKAQAMEDLQRAKADFLNTRRRLEDDLGRDRERQINIFVEKLLPMADSFFMAMSDKAMWQSIDKNWRIGVESIHSQLQSLLREYSVSVIDEISVPFDPERHEAISTVPVTETDQDHLVMEVIQSGYEREVNGKKELIRPARVIVGEYISN